VSRAGYVLVGGRSSRMGCDKALLPFGGGCLAESVTRAVSLRTALADLLAAAFSVPELLPFQDVNTPEEWAPYASK